MQREKQEVHMTSEIGSREKNKRAEQRGREMQRPT